MGVALQIECLVLALLGLMSLSAFLLTVVLSDKVTRHPVFMNFICTWVIWSVFMIFRYVRVIARASLCTMFGLCEYYLLDRPSPITA
jgi:hypothetical protein